MYKSPIDIIHNAVQNKMEDDVVKAVQSYEIVVDKKELLRALGYDRGQYDKGYADGYDKICEEKDAEIQRLKEQLEEKPKGVWQEEIMEYICSHCKQVFHDDLPFITIPPRMPNYCPNCGVRMEINDEDE